MKLIPLCFNAALNIRHGAILGVSEIIIGLSGNSILNRKTALDRAFRTLSLKERNLIKEETGNQKEFRIMYEGISAKDYLDSVLDEEKKGLITGLVN